MLVKLKRKLVATVQRFGKRGCWRQNFRTWSDAVHTVTGQLHATAVETRIPIGSSYALLSVVETAAH